MFRLGPKVLSRNGPGKPASLVAALLASSSLVGAALLARSEASGLFTAFDATDKTKAVLVRNNGDTYFSPDAFFSNAGTSPKLVYDVTGTLVWSPHNLATQSDVFTSASWTKDGATATAGQLLETATTAVHRAYNSEATFISGSTYTFSAKLKSVGGRQWAYIDVLGSGLPTYFDIINGVVGTNTSGNSATITSLGGGEFLCQIARVSAVTTGYFIVGSASADGVNSFLGDVAKGVAARNIQINRGAVPTAYLATTSAARFGLAIDYDPVTHACKGLLVEPAATNVLLKSQDFSATWGTFAGGTGTGTVPVVTADQSASPDGSTTADLIRIPVRSASTRQQSVYQVFTGTAASYAGSVYVRAETGGDIGKQIELGLYNGTSFVGTVVVTLTASWQRVSATGTLAASAACEADIGRLGTGLTADLTAVGFYVWQGQAELGSVATSPIPSFAATVTRAADSPNFLLSAIPALGSAYSYLLDYEEAGVEAVSTAYVLSIDDDSLNNYATVRHPSTSIISARVNSGNVLSAEIDTLAVQAAATRRKVAVRVEANNFGTSAQGGAAQLDTSGAIPVSPTRVGLAMGLRSNRANPPNYPVHIYKLVIVTRSWSDGELQARST